MHFIRIRIQSVSPCISCVVDADLTVIRLKNLGLGVMYIWVLLSRIIICGRMYWIVRGGIWSYVDCMVMRCFDILVNILRSSIIASHARDGSFSSFQQSCNFLPQRKDQDSQLEIETDVRLTFVCIDSDSPKNVLKYYL